VKQLASHATPWTDARWYNLLQQHMDHSEWAYRESAMAALDLEAFYGNHALHSESRWWHILNHAIKDDEVFVVLSSLKVLNGLLECSDCRESCLSKVNWSPLIHSESSAIKIAILQLFGRYAHHHEFMNTQILQKWWNTADTELRLALLEFRKFIPDGPDFRADDHHVPEDDVLSQLKDTIMAMLYEDEEHWHVDCE